MPTFHIILIILLEFVFRSFLDYSKSRQIVQIFSVVPLPMCLCDLPTHFYDMPVHLYDLP